MSDSSGKSQEFRELLVALTDGKIIEEQFARLNELLAENPVFRQDYLHQLQIHTLLLFGQDSEIAPLGSAETFAEYIRKASNQAAWQIHDTKALQLSSSVFPGISEGSSVQNAPLNSSSGVTLRNTLLVWAPFLVIFGIGFMTHLIWDRIAEDSPSAEQRSSLASRELPKNDGFVARLVSKTGTVWNATSHQPLESGDQLRFQETVTIQEGLATFEVIGGMTLNLEGPAVVSVDPDGVPVIQYGKVIASLPWGAKRTVIKTSLGEVQFDGDDIAGIGVFGSGLNVYVFRGEVLIEARNTEEKSFLLGSGEGHSLSVSSLGKRYRVASKLKQNFFGSWDSISTDLLLISDAYVASVRKSQPVGYWRFEEVVEGQVLNEVSNKHHGTLGGKARLVLQETNHVMEFGFGENSGHLFMEEPFDELAGSDYAFEVWVKLNHYHRSTIAALAEHRSGVQEEEKTAFLLETLGGRLAKVHLARPHALRFLHRSPPGSDLLIGKSCYSSKDYESRKWQHVVAVKQGHEMRLYLNGRISATEEDRTDLVSGLHLVVGQLYSFEPVRPFVGQIDELAVYDHALSSQEIRSRYRMARRVQQE